MNSTFTWEGFWKDWRNERAVDETDLFYQVGRTIQKKPIGKDIFSYIIKNITDSLALNNNDVLVELCCGNGLCTYELKDQVKKIIAVDFSPHLIEAAQRMKSAANITYTLESVFDFLENFSQKHNAVPTKYLMNNALAYFTPADLDRILSKIATISNDNFLFLIRDVPNDLLKWNFYNTEERKQKYQEDIAKGDITNNGIGRWWAPEEINEVCIKNEMNCVIFDQHPNMSDYRMDIVIHKK